MSQLLLFKANLARSFIVFVIGLALFMSASSVTLANSSAVKQSVASGNQANWPQFGIVPLGGRFNFLENQLGVSNVSQLQVAWKATLDSNVFTSPAVVNGTVYVGTFPGGNFYALHASTGATLWMQHTIGSTVAPSSVTNVANYPGIVASPAVANGLAYVGTRENGAFYAFSAQTGAIQYVVNTGGLFFDHDATTVVSNRVIYQADDHGKLFAFNARTGATLWTALSIGFDSGPAVYNGVVYVGSNDGKLYAFDAITGALKWTASTGGPISSSPAVANGLVYANSQDGYLYAFNLLGCGASSCLPVWKGSTGTAEGSTYVSSPAVANGMVYIGSATQDKLFAFNAFGCGATICSPVWSAATTGIILASPAVANGVVYVTAWDGYIYAFDAQTGQELWLYNMNGGEIESSPVVVNGVVYVGATFANVVYAFALPGTTS